MANPLELAKKHPVISTVVVVVVVGVVFLFSGGGSAQAAVATDGGGGVDETAMAMQSLQAAYGAKALELGTAKEIAFNENATRVTLAGLSKDVTLFDLERNYAYKEKSLESEERTTSLVSTLQAALQEKQIAANAETTAAMFANIRSQQDAAVALANINAQSAAQLAEINSRPKGLLSFLFG